MRKINIGILITSQPFIRRLYSLIKSTVNYKDVEIDLRPIEVSNKENILSSLNNIEILVADPKLCCDIFTRIPRNVKWVQCSWAGLDGLLTLLDRNQIKNYVPHFTITRLGQCFGPAMADYVLGAVISLERDFRRQYIAQQNCQWLTAKDAHSVYRYRILSSLTIGILGVGNIGLEIATSLKLVGMKVLGLKRTAVCEKEMEKYPVDEFYMTSDLAKFLPSCDYICNVLPHTPDTVDLLSGDVLRVCEENKPGFINVGRGSIINEESLVKALNMGWLSSAFLDVFLHEPLEASNPLWQMENVTITPHTSGLLVNPGQGAIVFVENLKLYIEGKPLTYIFDWELGY